MNAAALQAAHSLINTNTPNPARLDRMILQKRRAQKHKLVSDWLATLPKHWDLEGDISGNLDGDGEIVSDGSRLGESERGSTQNCHGRTRANLEQKMKLGTLKLPLPKRKGVFDEEVTEVYRLNTNVEVEETKKEMTVVGRPVKRVKRAVRNVVVIAS